MKKLIGMTDYVLALDVAENIATYEQDFNRIISYANFLKQTLTLGMFIPCDENGNVLEEPKKEHYTDCKEEQNAKDWLYNLDKYQQAKSKVIFEGFEIYKHKENCMIKDNVVYEWRDNNNIAYIGNTIEHLTLSNDDFFLTDNVKI